jgi:hypothetical protein
VIGQPEESGFSDRTTQKAFDVTLWYRDDWVRVWRRRSDGDFSLWVSPTGDTHSAVGKMFRVNGKLAGVLGEVLLALRSWEGDD